MSNDVDQFLNGRLPCSALESELITFARTLTDRLATAEKALADERADHADSQHKWNVSMDVGLSALARAESAESELAKAKSALRELEFMAAQLARSEEQHSETADKRYAAEEALRATEAQLATAKEQLREMEERPTPRFDSYWNSYRSGAINANEFRESMRQMERDLEGRLKEAEALVVTGGSKELWEEDKHTISALHSDLAKAEADLATATTALADARARVKLVEADKRRLCEALRQVRDGIVIKDGWGTIRVAPIEMVNAGQIPTEADRNSFELMYDFISRAIRAADRSAMATNTPATGDASEVGKDSR